MYHNSKQVSGFTLLELFIAISVAGILTMMAIPTFDSLIRNSRLTTYTNELVTSLNLARSEAIKRGVTVTVRKISAAGASTYWSSSGWNVFVDNNANGTLDAGEEILRTYNQLPSKFILAGNGLVLVDRISYQSDGTDNNTAGSFALCDISGGNGIPPKPYTSRLIIISSVGRVRMGKDANSDGIPETSSGTALSNCTTAS